MFDTMKLTAGFASLCAGLLILLLGGWAADGLYGIDRHGDDEPRGYVVMTDEGMDEVAVADDVVEVAFADVYAAADAAAGERLWRQCSACHALEPGQNGVGPYLHGVVGRQIGVAEGYNFSDTLAGMDDAWTPENISAFIENPRGWAPGTAMAYNGMREIEDRANLIAYLATFQ